MENNKFIDNPFTEVEPKSNCYDSLSPNDKHLDNDIMNTLKRNLQKFLLSNGFFLFHDIQSKCSKNNEQEEIECEVFGFDHGSETNDNTDFQIKIADNFPLPF